jgi:hypothetical protein
MVRRIASTEAEGVEARAFRTDLVRALKRWGTTQQRRDWAGALLGVYISVEELQGDLAQSDLSRHEVLEKVELAFKSASGVAKPPEGATASETKAFRSEILALFSVHQSSLKTDLEPGEFGGLLDWGDQDPDWAVRIAGFKPAEADSGLALELSQHRTLASSPSPDHDKI